jgi:predicted cupin superfamily sugar epimerase
MIMTNAEEIIKILNLQEHPVEGGYFLETYKSSQTITVENLPPGYKGDRSFSTAIYYMLVPGTYSEMHRLKGDEVFHFYSGSPVEMLQLFPDGSGKKIIIGNDIMQGESPQVLAPAGVWQGSRLLPGGDFALMGATVAPGFDYSDYQSGKREELVLEYPQFKELISLLTRED